MTRVAVIGAGGYAAGELLRLLVHHPDVNLVAAVSASQAGKRVHEVHRDLRGDTELCFGESLSPGADADFVFLCRGHGQAAAYLDDHPGLLELPIVDLSTDFRPRNNARGFVYGLPEINRARIRRARHVANPGCFATAIQLAVLPLADESLLDAPVHVHAITGSTGAGQRPSPTGHFAYRTSNLSVYKAFGHQHLAEIRESVRQLLPTAREPIHFVPIRGDFARGIFASAYTATDLDTAQALELYEQFYAAHPFVHVTADTVSLKEAVGTNKGLLQVGVHGGQLHVVSVIDNLLKGAAGQAVQNMNLMLGLDEAAGLRLKGIGY